MSQNNPNHLRAGRYTRGFLPHIRVESRPYFVTFRLAGTLPQGVLGRFKAERELLIEKLCHSGPQPSSDDRKRLDERHSEKLESYWDASYGDCWLKDLRIAELVAKALKFFDGQRYELSAWVIMPNHVHAILRPLGTHRLDEIIKSWKSYTGRKANEILHRTNGAFWEREYYDHVIRDDDEKVATIAYIHNNPMKAGLCSRPEEWKWSSARRM